MIIPPQRIKILIEKLGIKDKDFAENLGITGGYVSGMQKIEGRKLSKTLIKLICKEYNVNEEWLLKGEGYIFGLQEIDSLKVYELLRSARRVLTSNTQHAISLEQNINSFDQAVKDQIELKKLKDQETPADSPTDWVAGKYEGGTK